MLGPRRGRMLHRLAGEVDRGGLPLDGRESEGLAGELVGSEHKLREGFERFGNPARLHVRAGWFDDTLSPAAREIGAVAILHCDGDWFESVLLTLEVMYPLVSPGEYRLGVGETASLRRIDRSGRYWRKGTGPGAAL
jgi:hypothetical protein